MQLINIYFTKTEIGYYLPDEPNTWNSIQLKVNGAENSLFLSVSDGFKELLERVEQLDTFKLNLILDQNFTLYSYLKLPLISKRKISNILQNELSNYLVNDLSEYHYDYQVKVNKEQSQTECGVYFIKKDLVENLLKIARLLSVEISGIYPLNHLIDQKYKAASEILNESRIYLDLVNKNTKVFVYNHGFLSGYATIFDGSDSLEALLKTVNKKIAAIVLQENQIEFSKVDTSQPDIFVENEVSEIICTAESKVSSEQLPHPDYSHFNQFFKPGALPKFNLLKSNLLIFKELKKYSGRLMVSASLFFICVMLYLTNVGFNIYSNNQVNKQLNLQYTQLIQKYLPKGTSKINAIYILEQRIAEYKAQEENSKKYADKKYETLKFVKDVSLFKTEITSLIINRLSLGQNSISVLGKVDTLSDYELLQEAIIKKYPEDHYRLKMDQKSRGNESINFTATIRPI